MKEYLGDTFNKLFLQDKFCYVFEIWIGPTRIISDEEVGLVYDECEPSKCWSTN